MRKIIGIAIVLIANFAFAQEVIIPFNQLPAKAKTFIHQHFKDVKIMNVIQDKDVFSKDFDVNFENGTKIEFDRTGNWKEIKTLSGSVLSSLVPAKIKQYISNNYKGANIVEINKDAYKIDVELSNGVDLDFDKNGNFLRIDR